MKLLFVHDHFFYKDQDGLYYSAGGFPWYLWNKYLNHFDEITVIGRYGGKVDDTQKYVRSSFKGVSFQFVDIVSSPKGLLKIGKVRSQITHCIRISDAVVVRLPSENGLMAARIAKRLEKPYAIEVVGCAWDALWNYGNLTSKIYAPVIYNRMQRTVKYANQVLYVTSEFLQRRYKHSKNAYVVNASNVDISDFSKEILEKRIRNISNIDVNSHILKIGLIGNFKTKYKGLHVAIQALGVLKKEYRFNNFQLQILGKGNPTDYQNLIAKNKCDSNVLFHGTLPNGEPVLKWLDDLDFYLQPSLTEGLPRSLLEAMSRGNICIGSKTGGIPELLGNNFVTKPGDAKQLALKLWEVIHLSKNELNSIAQNNYSTSRQYESQKLELVRHNFYEALKIKAQSRKNETA